MRMTDSMGAEGADARGAAPGAEEAGRETPGKTESRARDGSHVVPDQRPTRGQHGRGADAVGTFSLASEERPEGRQVAVSQVATHVLEGRRHDGQFVQCCSG